MLTFGSKRCHLSACCLLLLLFTGMQVVNAQQTPPLRDKTKWLRDAKFGMLISWGPYAQVGGGEDVMAKYRLNAKDYDKLIKSFTATHCNPEAWVLQAKAAGMRYIVFSAKGPDGFSMYEGKFKERDITGTPYRQDVLMQLVRACNKYRMPLGVYYSRIDRLNPEYHPKMSGGPKIINGSIHNWTLWKERVSAEVLDIAAKYRPVLFWFDGDLEQQPDSTWATALHEKLVAKIPDVLINNRLLLRGSTTVGDFQTPELQVPSEAPKHADGTPAPFEVLKTFSNTRTLGYDADEENYISSRELIRDLADAAGKGGNILLNTALSPQGDIPDEYKIRMNTVGRWLSRYGESIYNTSPGLFERLPFYGRSTLKGNSIYLHVFTFPTDGILRIPAIENNIQNIKLLGPKGQSLTYSLRNNQIVIKLPVENPEADAAVIRIDCEGIPKLKSMVPVYAPIDTVIELTAPFAELLPSADGFKLKQYYKHVMLENWTDREQMPQWKFALREEGNYQIQVYSSGVEGCRPAACLVEIDGSRFLKGKAERKSTTLPEPTMVGAVHLGPGEHTLHLSVIDKPDAQVMKLEKVVLRKL